MPSSNCSPRANLDWNSLAIFALSFNGWKFLHSCAVQESISARAQFSTRLCPFDNMPSLRVRKHTRDWSRCIRELEGCCSCRQTCSAWPSSKAKNKLDAQHVFIYLSRVEVQGVGRSSHYYKQLQLSVLSSLSKGYFFKISLSNVKSHPRFQNCLFFKRK